jgi:hypothetical protein
MLIKQKRIRNLSRHLGFITPGTMVRAGVPIISEREPLLRRTGFSDNLAQDECVLPAGDFGTVSRFNASGKEIVHRDQEMETAYRMVEWHWTEWHGPDEVERSDFVDVPYKRYPRTFVPPPSVELMIATAHCNRLVCTSPIEHREDDQTALLHAVNLLLEIFGECEIFTQDLLSLFKRPLHRLNWEVLPPGEWPWEKLQRELKPLVKRAPEGKQPVIKARLKAISKYGPSFVAVGRAGFRGYVVFAFPEHDTFVLESIHHGNATYVFGHKWDKLSQLTKAEVLSEHLQKDRIIHRKTWHQRIQTLLADVAA